MGLALGSRLEQRRYPARVVLTGRATSVPFTAVLTGLQRTIMDNTTGASTCTGPRLSKGRSCPNWLWDQGVADPRSITEGLRPTKINRLPGRVITTNGLWTFLDRSWELAPLSRIDRRRDRRKGGP
jgi:hypothetical protein